jgi:hypothetical protein
MVMAWFISIKANKPLSNAFGCEVVFSKSFSFGMSSAIAVRATSPKGRIPKI